MRSKLLFIFISCFLIFSVVGCSDKNDVGNKDTKTDIIETKNLEKYDLKKIDSFHMEDANQLLQDSKTLAHSENITFTPLILNDKGKVFGESRKPDNTMALLMLDVEDDSYREIFTSEEGSTIGVSGANDDFVLFSVVNQFKQTVMYYCKDIKNNTLHTIFKSEYRNGVAVPDVAMVDNIAYISLPTPDDSNSISYPLVHYDMKKNKQEVIEEGRVVYPVYFENKLYYIRLDNDKKTTDIIQYDPHSKEKTILARGNERDGIFYNLTTDGISLITQLYYAGNAINFYKIETSPVKLSPYFAIRGADSFKGYEGYFTWFGERVNDEQIRKPISFFDSQKQVTYTYDGNLIYFSKKGILWVKYTKDEKDIPKAEIFTKDNSVLMWYPFT